MHTDINTSYFSKNLKGLSIHHVTDIGLVKPIIIICTLVKDIIETLSKDLQLCKILPDNKLVIVYLTIYYSHKRNLPYTTFGITITMHKLGLNSECKLR